MLERSNWRIAGMGDTDRLHSPPIADTVARREEVDFSVLATSGNGTCDDEKAPVMVLGQG
jgi:hypothetical protein